MSFGRRNGVGSLMGRSLNAIGGGTTKGSQASPVAPEELSRALTARVDQLKAQLLVEIPAAQVTAIQQRLTKGVGLDDKSMPPLTAAYARRKGKSGRKRTLLDTGRMRRAIYVRSRPNEAQIFFSDGKSLQLAKWHQKRAKWFGVSPKDRQKLHALIREILKGS